MVEEERAGLLRAIRRLYEQPDEWREHPEPNPGFRRLEVFPLINDSLTQSQLTNFNTHRIMILNGILPVGLQMKGVACTLKEHHVENLEGYCMRDTQGAASTAEPLVYWLRADVEIMAFGLCGEAFEEDAPENKSQEEQVLGWPNTSRSPTDTSAKDNIFLCDEVIPKIQSVLRTMRLPLEESAGLLEGRDPDGKIDWGKTRRGLIRSLFAFYSIDSTIVGFSTTEIRAKDSWTFGYCLGNGYNEYPRILNGSYRFRYPDTPMPLFTQLLNLAWKLTEVLSTVTERICDELLLEKDLNKGDFVRQSDDIKWLVGTALKYIVKLQKSFAVRKVRESAGEPNDVLCLGERGPAEAYANAPSISSLRILLVRLMGVESTLDQRNSFMYDVLLFKTKAPSDGSRDQSLPINFPDRDCRVFLTENADGELLPEEGRKMLMSCNCTMSQDYVRNGAGVLCFDSDELVLDVFASRLNLEQRPRRGDLYLAKVIYSQSRVCDEQGCQIMMIPWWLGGGRDWYGEYKPKCLEVSTGFLRLEKIVRLVEWQLRRSAHDLLTRKEAPNDLKAGQLVWTELL